MARRDYVLCLILVPVTFGQVRSGWAQPVEAAIVQPASARERGGFKGFVSLGLDGGAGWVDLEHYRHDGSTELGGNAKIGFVINRNWTASLDWSYLGYLGEGDVLHTISTAS